MILGVDIAVSQRLFALKCRQDMVSYPSFEPERNTNVSFVKDRPSHLTLLR